MSTRRRILPDGDFGISSMISTARTFLYGATRSATNRVTSSGVIESARHDERFGHLAGFLVGERDHGRVGDRRVREQERLQFGGGDLVALVLDQLLDPVDDPQRAVLLDAGDVAGVQPAVGVDRLRGRLRVVEVALHHLRAADQELARLARRRVLAGRDVDDPAFGVRYQAARSSRASARRARP